MAVKMKAFLPPYLVLTLLLNNVVVYGQNTAPFFTNLDRELTISEATAPGTRIYQVEGTDYESEVYYGLLETEYFSIDSVTGAITLEKPLDYEMATEVQLVLTLADLLETGEINPATVQVNLTVHVTDINDNIPVFEGDSPIRISIDKNLTVRKDPLLIATITDRDTVGAPLTITCFELPNRVLPNSCDYIAISYLTQNTQESVISLQLQDFFYESNAEQLEFALNASDGQFFVLAEVYLNVQVTDVKEPLSPLPKTDTPAGGPKFNRESMTLLISEDLPSGSAVLIEPRIQISPGGDSLTSILEVEVRQINPPLVDSKAPNFAVSPNRTVGSSQVDLMLINSSVLNVDGPSVIYGNFKAIELEIVVKAAKTEEKGYAVLPVTLNVVDVNDNPPVFNPWRLNFNLPLYAAPGTVIGEVSVFDNDKSAEFGPASLILQLEGDCDACFSLRQINASSYAVGVAECDANEQCLGPELNPISMTILAADELGSGYQRRAALILTKTTPQNNEIFTFDRPLYTAEIPENAIYFTTFPVFEMSRSVRFNLSDPLDIFGVDNLTGTLVVLQPSQVSAKVLGRQHNVTIQAFNGVAPPSWAVISIMTSGQTQPNNSPAFLNQTYIFTLPEGAQQGFVVGNIIATDIDVGDSLSYGMVSDPYGLFSIEPDTGIISYTGSPFPLEDELTLSVFAVDTGKPGLVTTTEATFSIEGVRTVQPVLIYPTAAELTGPIGLFGADTENLLITHLVATDPDAGELAFEVIEVTPYVHGESVSNFSLPGTIQLKPADPTCNVCRSNGSSHIFSRSLYLTDPSLVDQVFALRIKVKIWDKMHFQEEPIIVTLLRSNTFPKTAAYGGRPGLKFIPPGPYEISVPESIAIDSYLFNVIALSAADEALIVYSFSEPTSYFGIDRTQGVVVLKSELDYEFITRHIVSVKATNQRSGEFVESELTINVINNNDNLPEFREDPYRFSVVENTEIGALVKEVEAVDKDGGYVTYRLTGNHSELFLITEDGSILVNGVLDREELHSFAILVIASDNLTDGSVKEASVPIYVTLLDQNDNDPKFSDRIYSAAVVENTPPGIQILQMHALDPDLGPDGTLEFSLLGLDRALKGRIVVDPASGTIKVVGSLLNTARREPYDFTGVVKDGGGRNASVPIKISIQPASQCAPTFVLPRPNSTVFTVAENSPENTHVGFIKVETPGPQCINEYVLLAESDAETDLALKLFTLNPSTGELTVRKPLDYEDRRNYYLIVGVRSSDSGATFNAQMRVQIHVENEDDNLPRFLGNAAVAAVCNATSECTPNSKAESSFIFKILEEEEKGSAIGLISAQDLDFGNTQGKLKYFIEGPDAESFMVDPETGMLSLQQSLDRESKTKYKFLAVVNKKDHDSLNYTEPSRMSTTVEVHVMDSNDNPPMFTQKIVRATVNSSAPIGTVVAELVAKDPDLVTFSSDIAYRIVDSKYIFKGQENARSIDQDFYLMPNSGQVVLNSSLVRYANVHFSLSVQAYDVRVPEISDNATLLIWVHNPDQLMKMVLKETPEAAAVTVDRMVDDVSRSIDKTVLLHDLSYYYEPNGNISPDKTVLEAIFVGPKSMEILSAPEVTKLLAHRKSDISLAFYDVKAATSVEHFTRGLSVAAIGLILLIGVLFFGLLGFICFLCYLRYTYLTEEKEWPKQVEEKKQMPKIEPAPPRVSPMVPKPPPPPPNISTFQAAYGPVTINPLCMDAFEPPAPERSVQTHRRPGAENPEPGVASIVVPDYTNAPDVVQDSVSRTRRKRDALYETLNK